MAEIRGRVLCRSVLSACKCREDADHTSPHKCPCGSSWTGEEDTDGLTVLKLPPIASLLYGGIPGLGPDDSW
jgi:hypothetical protein